MDISILICKTANHFLCCKDEILKRLSSVHFKNEHCGRKNKFCDEEIENIKNSNKSYRAIAKEFGCSVGLVCKIKKGGD